MLMPDTPAHQEAYPQHGTQAEGCGFPLARIVALFGLPREIYDRLPPTLTLRELSCTLQQKGFRTKHVPLVTTLLDPKAERAKLYGLRWTAELALRHLKTTMGMEMLTTKTPQRVRKKSPGISCPIP